MKYRKKMEFHLIAAQMEHCYYAKRMRTLSIIEAEESIGKIRRNIVTTLKE